MTDKTDSIRDLFGKGLADLRTMRDEMKVKLHLAGMDAKEAWKELEPRLEAAEKQASEITEATATATVEAAQKMISDLSSSFEDLRKKLVGDDKGDNASS
jgi:lipid II:glycine glycyltransferase (peptidoglycan interpeptide bridge formation enzyme)